MNCFYDFTSRTTSWQKMLGHQGFYGHSQDFIKTFIKKMQIVTQSLK